MTKKMMLMLAQAACDGPGFCIMANCIRIIVHKKLFTSGEQESFVEQFVGSYMGVS